MIELFLLIGYGIRGYFYFIGTTPRNKHMQQLASEFGLNYKRLKLSNDFKVLKKNIITGTYKGKNIEIYDNVYWMIDFAFGNFPLFNTLGFSVRETIIKVNRNIAYRAFGRLLKVQDIKDKLEEYLKHGRVKTIFDKNVSFTILITLLLLLLFGLLVYIIFYLIPKSGWTPSISL